MTFTQHLQFLGDTLIKGILFDVSNYRAAGMTESKIKARLLEDWEAGIGAIAAFQKQTEQMVAAVQQRFYMKGAYGDASPESQFTWHAIGVSTCPGCLDRTGKTKTFRQWQSEGLPGAGATVCKFRCRCTLLPVERAYGVYGLSGDKATPENLEKVIRAPIEKKRKEIAKQEKARGKPYAASTVEGKLGDYREAGSADTTDPRVATTSTGRKSAKQLVKEYGELSAKSGRGKGDPGLEAARERARLKREQAENQES